MFTNREVGCLQTGRRDVYKQGGGMFTNREEGCLQTYCILATNGKIDESTFLASVQKCFFHL